MKKKPIKVSIRKQTAQICALISAIEQRQRLINQLDLLDNPIYIRGLEQPLTAAADILEQQGQQEYAEALRIAVKICVRYPRTLTTKDKNSHRSTRRSSQDI